LRVLITNIELWPPSGTVRYVRDLALELQRQGHTPTVFSSTAGPVVEELRGAGVAVTDRLGRLQETPDIIHGHHHAPTLVALRRWPTIPAIHVCHDHTSPNDRTPIHPNIRHHFGVSRVCVRRLVGDGVPESRTNLLLNFVDTARFAPRTPLPERPRRALVFSNYARKGGHLPAVIEACAQAGLELDVVGAGMGKIVTRPERLLGNYEIVFAKAKAAMEAMAVGTAVILCDYSGVGPMVTSDGFDGLRPLNFGFEALRDPIRREPLLREIARYDPEDAARVRDLLRSSAGLVAAVESLVAIYQEAIADHRRGRSRSNARRPKRWSIREQLFLRLYWQWMSLSPKQREKLTTLPGVRFIKRAVLRLLRQTR
jgi:glycosyltransferase involved in cell wall biosynthesis